MFGFNFRPKRQPPCATRRIPKVSPRLSWYIEPPAQMFLGGLIPFLIIFGEMDNIYASLWSHKVCGAFNTLLRDFIVVIITTIVVEVRDRLTLLE
ncbi:hypothetical protein F0562_016059 [Nyssa sinensis]|uniref:Transmembrane 9 superfamily member n=1 Tax=Nyssa sinensis TaxID=561372 RepID=A0A5J4ZIY3_9ASTE|nr:hypothetical protein F0562_016059 [Nyssa sinensis]